MKPINILPVLALTLVLGGAALAGAQQFNFTTLAGPAGAPSDSDGAGSTDGTASGARFNFPSGVAVDRVSNVYVADWGNSTIRKITPDGVVSTLAGLAGSLGSADGTASAARFSN